MIKNLLVKLSTELDYIGNYMSNKSKNVFYETLPESDSRRLNMVSNPIPTNTAIGIGPLSHCCSHETCPNIFVVFGNAMSSFAKEIKSDIKSSENEVKTWFTFA